MSNFFSKIAAFFKKVFGSTKWEHVASTTIKLVAPLLGTVVGLAAGETAGSEVVAVCNEVASDLAISATLIDHIAAGNAALPDLKSQIVNTLQTAQANLQTLLTAGHIKDPNTLTKVTSIVTMIDGELTAILQVIP